MKNEVAYTGFIQAFSTKVENLFDYIKEFFYCKNLQDNN